MGTPVRPAAIADKSLRAHYNELVKWTANNTTRYVEKLALNDQNYLLTKVAKVVVALVLSMLLLPAASFVATASHIWTRMRGARPPASIGVTPPPAPPRAFPPANPPAAPARPVPAPPPIPPAPAADGGAPLGRAVPARVEAAIPAPVNAAVPAPAQAAVPVVLEPEHPVGVPVDPAIFAPLNEEIDRQFAFSPLVDGPGPIFAALKQAMLTYADRLAAPGAQSEENRRLADDFRGFAAIMSSDEHEVDDAIVGMIAVIAPFKEAVGRILQEPIEVHPGRGRILGQLKLALEAILGVVAPHQAPGGTMSAERLAGVLRTVNAIRAFNGVMMRAGEAQLESIAEEPAAAGAAAGPADAAPVHAVRVDSAVSLRLFFKLVDVIEEELEKGRPNAEPMFEALGQILIQHGEATGDRAEDFRGLNQVLNAADFLDANDPTVRAAHSFKTEVIRLLRREEAPNRDEVIAQLIDGFKPVTELWAEKRGNEGSPDASRRKAALLALNEALQRAAHLEIRGRADRIIARQARQAPAAAAEAAAGPADVPAKRVDISVDRDLLEGLVDVIDEQLAAPQPNLPMVFAMFGMTLLEHGRRIETRYGTKEGSVSREVEQLGSLFATLSTILSTATEDLDEQDPAALATIPFKTGIADLFKAEPKPTRVQILTEFKRALDAVVEELLGDRTKERSPEEFLKGNAVIEFTDALQRAIAIEPKEVRAGDGFVSYRAFLSLVDAVDDELEANEANPDSVFEAFGRALLQYGQQIETKRVRRVSVLSPATTQVSDNLESLRDLLSLSQEKSRESKDPTAQAMVPPKEEVVRLLEIAPRPSRGQIFTALQGTLKAVLRSVALLPRTIELIEEFNEALMRAAEDVPSKKTRFNSADRSALNKRVQTREERVTSRVRRAVAKAESSLTPGGADGGKSLREVRRRLADELAAARAPAREAKAGADDDAVPAVDRDGSRLTTNAPASPRDGLSGEEEGMGSAGVSPLPAAPAHEANGAAPPPSPDDGARAQPAASARGKGARLSSAERRRQRRGQR